MAGCQVVNVCGGGRTPAPIDPLQPFPTLSPSLNPTLNPTLEPTVGETFIEPLPTLNPTLSPTFSPTMGATPTVSKETSSPPTFTHGRPFDHTRSEEVGSNDFQFGVYKKEVVSSCDEVIGDNCVKTCTDTTYVYNGDILISETQGEEYETPCDVM